MFRAIPPLTFKILGQLEGDVLTAYWDAIGGVWTIGRGHTHGVNKGDVITQKQSDDFAAGDLFVAASGVCRVIKAPLSDNQYAALILFQLNTGGLTQRDCQLRDLLNAGDYAGASAQFLRWNKGTNPKTGMKESIPGLTNRRLAEQAIFNKVD